MSIENYNARKKRNTLRYFRTMMEIFKSLVLCRVLVCRSCYAYSAWLRDIKDTEDDLHTRYLWFSRVFSKRILIRSRVGAWEIKLIDAKLHFICHCPDKNAMRARCNNEWKKYALVRHRQVRSRMKRLFLINTRRNNYTIIIINRIRNKILYYEYNLNKEKFFKPFNYYIYT